jgi:type II secretory pathway component PulM
MIRMMRMIRTEFRSPKTMAFVLVLAGVALLVLLAIRPALQILEATRTQAPELQAQWSQLLRMQAQAKTLQALPNPARVDAKAALDAALPNLGPDARSVVAGERATVTFKNVTPEAFALWLSKVREEARASAVEVHIRRNANAWSGSVLLQLPAP